MAKITDIFNFLKDYNDIRNPVITEIEKQLWYYKLSNLPQISELWSIYDTDDFDNLKILEVKRPTILPCPPPNMAIEKWLEQSWDNINIKEINYIELKTRVIKDENGEMVEEIEYFIDDENRLKEYNTWIELRNIWLETEGPKEIGLKLYNELFSLYSRFKREAESLELVLGDGFINWDIDSRRIYHPVLLQKVNLEFDSNKPSFIINCDEIKTELYTPMLRVIKSIK